MALFLYNWLYGTKSNDIQDVVFCNDKITTACQIKDHERVKCTTERCLFRIQNEISKHIRTAKQTVDLCMYHLSSSVIIKELIHAQTRGVKIRIITDEEIDDDNRDRLIRVGSRLVYNYTKNTHDGQMLMHHKFCVIDRDREDSFLINGSLNWSKTSFMGSSTDATLITNNRVLINDFFIEFERIWRFFLDF